MRYLSVSGHEIMAAWLRYVACGVKTAPEDDTYGLAYDFVEDDAQWVTQICRKHQRLIKARAEGLEKHADSPKFPLPVALVPREIIVAIAKAFEKGLLPPDVTMKTLTSFTDYAKEGARAKSVKELLEIVSSPEYALLQGLVLLTFDNIDAARWGRLNGSKGGRRAEEIRAAKLVKRKVGRPRKKT